MTPKFRGGSEDWLDADLPRDTPGVSRKKSKRARSVNLSLEDTNAWVVEVFPNQCRVKMDDHSFLLCHYRRAEVVGKAHSVRERTPVAVGDRVKVSCVGQKDGRVEGISPRKNGIVRPAPGRDGKKSQHIVAANLDLLVIVASAQEPLFSPGLVDRFSIAAMSEKIPVLLCITKVDLVGGQSNPVRPWESYWDLGFESVETSVRNQAGISILAEKIQNKTVAFCGQSGVGKTSLLRALLGSEVGRVEKVNEYTGKGRHTTTSAVLLDGPYDSHWIDTPGVREFGLMGITPKALGQYFPEFQASPCGQAGCEHFEESECGVRNFFRYPSYRRIYISLKEET